MVANCGRFPLELHSDDCPVAARSPPLKKRGTVLGLVWARNLCVVGGPDLTLALGGHLEAWRARGQHLVGTSA